MSRAARKRAEQAAELRGEIIDAGFAEFAEKGYHQTTISDIAKRLQVSSGTVYNYFKNKRDIVDHVVDRLTGRLLDVLKEENAPGLARTADEYREQALRIAGAVDAIFYEDPRVPRVLLFEATSIDAELTERMFALFDTARDFGVAYLGDGVERGFFRPDLDVAATADLISGMILGFAMRCLRTELEAPVREDFRKTFVSTLLDGIAVTPK